MEIHPWNAHADLRLCVPFVCRQMRCRYDDEIFEHILREFPEFAAAPHTNLVKLDEEGMKSKEGKERWRSFINACVSPPSPFHLAACSIIHLARTCTAMKRRLRISISAR
jgi:hypothetical protein